MYCPKQNVLYKSPSVFILLASLKSGLRSPLLKQKETLINFEALQSQPKGIKGHISGFKMTTINAPFQNYQNQGRAKMVV